MKFFIDFQKKLNESQTEVKIALRSPLRKEIQQKNGKIYQIGGVVRDSLIGKISKDLDILITGFDMNDLEDILKKYGKVDVVGKSFGVIKFMPFHYKKGDEPLDISVPRVDVKSTGEGHRDFEVKFGKDISLKQDQLRRDFFMNALAKDIETGHIHDIEGKGKSDVSKQLVRMISPKAFEDDPLRMLRAVQFASRFGFKIESETLKEIKKNADKIKTVSPDRLNEEFRKLFEKSEKPSIGIKYLIQTGLLSEIFPELNNKRFDYKTIDNIDKKYYPSFFAIFFISMKPEMVEQTIKEKIRGSNELSQIAAEVVDFLKNYGTRVSNEKLIRFSMKIHRDTIDHIDKIYSAKGQKINLNKRIDELKKKGIPTNFEELSVSGKDLMRKLKGPEIGQALTYIMGFAIRKMTNDRKLLLKELERKFSLKF